MTSEATRATSTRVYESEEVLQQLGTHLRVAGYVLGDFSSVR